MVKTALLSLCKTGENSMKFKNKKPIWVLSVLFVALVFYSVNNPSFIDSIYDKLGLNRTVVDGKLNVYFIDTEQSDAALITDGQSAFLVDGGDIDKADKVVSFIKSKGIKALDLVILSHAHEDHMGGLPEVLDEFKVDKFVMPEIPDKLVPTNKTYEKLLDALENNNINAEYAVKGKTFTYGDIEFEFFSPINEFDDLNDSSAVVKLSYGSSSFLFCGDAGTKVEKEILSDKAYLSSDVIKIGHHGSNTSSSEKFLTAVSPMYAVICVGKDNSYGHPSEKIINRLEDLDAKVYRTDQNGTITFLSDGNNITVTTEK